MNSQEARIENDDIDVKKLLLTLWRGKLWIVISVVFSAVLAIVYAIGLPNTYTANVVLSPAAEAGQSGLSSIAGRLGGLASLAGVSVGGGNGVDVSILGMETLVSRAFLTEFIKRHELVVPLMATKGWDSNSQSWEIDPDLYNEKSREWVRKVATPKAPKPSDWEVFKEFRQAIDITQDKKTQIITLSVESLSPMHAKLWAEKLVLDLNDYLRQKDVAQAERSIDYLKRQLESTSVAQMHAILYQLIEEQTKTIMLASVRDGYAFQVIDPAVVPEDKTGPRRSLIVIVAVFSGLILAVLGILTRESLIKPAHNEAYEITFALGEREAG